MSEINIKDMYFPTQFSSISGGLGVFNTSLIPICQEASGPKISGLVQNMLSDPSISYVTQPVSTSCRLSDPPCSSYLLPGGVQTVSPWPVNTTTPSLSTYVVAGSPSYQLDYGSLSADVSWSSDACKIYASEFASETIPLQLCIQDSTTFGTDGQLLAGWRVCPTRLNDAGDCDQPGSWEASQMWNTSLTIYRRNANVAASRTNMALLQAKELGAPVLQRVSANDLFQAYDSILTPLDEVSSGGNCSSLTPQSQLTEYLYLYLNQSAYTPNPSVSTPRDYIRNLLAIPLYLCNPLMLSSGYSPNTIQAGLPAQNYLRGSYATAATRAVPESWTIWTYAGMYGAILLLLLIVCVMVSGYDKPISSHFPVTDLLTSMRPEEMVIGGGEAAKQPVKLSYEDIFTGAQPGDNKAILRRASEIRMRLVQANTHL